MNRWIPETNPVIVRRVGKTGEEASELAAAAAQLACVCARIGIQGLAATDPSSGKTNRQRLIEEMADVQAQINTNIGVLLTDDEHRWLQQRTIEKMAQMVEWERLYEAAGPNDVPPGYFQAIHDALPSLPRLPEDGDTLGVDGTIDSMVLAPAQVKAALRREPAAPTEPSDEIKAARLSGYNTALVWNGRSSMQADSYEQIAGAWATSGIPAAALTPEQEARIQTLAAAAPGWDYPSSGRPLNPGSVITLRAVGPTLRLADASVFMTHEGNLSLQWRLGTGIVEAEFLP